MDVEDDRSQPVDDRWVYVLRDHGWGFKIEWEFRVSDGVFHKVDWREGKQPRGDLRDPTSEGDIIPLEGVDKLPVWMCVSQIQLPMARIAQFTGKDKSGKKRERVRGRFQQITERGGHINPRFVKDMETGSGGPSVAVRIYLFDTFDIVRRLQERYIDALQEYMDANMRHMQFASANVGGNKYKKGFLAKLAEETAKEYKQKEGDWPYDDEFDKGKLGDDSDYFDSVVESLNRRRDTVRRLDESKGFFSMRKYSTMELAGYEETRNDYMFDVQDRDGRDYRMMVLEKEASFVRGGIYSERAKDYIAGQIFDTSGDTIDRDTWYYRGFMRTGSDQQSSAHFLDRNRYGDSEAEVAIILTHIGMTLASQSSAKARSFFRDAISKWLGKDISEANVFELNEYLGEEGFPSVGAHVQFERNYEKAGLSETGAMAKLMQSYADYANKAGKDWPFTFVAKSKYPMLGTLGLIQFAVSADEGDVLGTVAAGGELVALLVEASSVPAAIAASGAEASLGAAGLFAVGSIAVVLAGFLGFAISLVKMLQAIEQGRPGQAIGWAIIGVGAAIGAVAGIGAWAAAASTAVTTGWTGWGLVAAAIVFIGTAVVLWFTDDAFEEWFDQSPWGPNTSNKSLDEQMSALLHLICRPKVRVSLWHQGAYFRTSDLGPDERNSPVGRYEHNPAQRWEELPRGAKLRLVVHPSLQGLTSFKFTEFVIWEYEPQRKTHIQEGTFSLKPSRPTQQGGQEVLTRDWNMGGKKISRSRRGGVSLAADVTIEVGLVDQKLWDAGFEIEMSGTVGHRFKNQFDDDLDLISGELEIQETRRTK
ncbi:MAG: hypothetical protein GVY12_06640 [Bacteroidetes bacterium]|nr:hypothetical protein [Bacteroidota bacterium]